MKHKTQLLVLGSALGLLGGSAQAAGSCVVSGTLAEMGATSVLRAQGQGNFSCADMSPGPDGPGMVDVTSHVTLTPGTTTQNGRLLSVNVTAPPSKEIDAVYIRTSGNGARCVYSFGNYSLSASNLQGGGAAFDLDDVLVCADLAGTDPNQPEVEPISTVGDGCIGEVAVTVDGVEQPIEDLAVVTGVSLDGQTLAICNGTGESTPQVECVNRCENFNPRAETPECATESAGLTNGEQDLEACRPCDLSNPTSPPDTDKDGNPLFYCWEYTSSVVRADLPLGSYPNMPGTQFIPGTSTPRTLGSMLPHKQTWSTADETTVFNKCYTTSRILSGRVYTYTTCY
jgi:hypothetical protein